MDSYKAVNAITLRGNLPSELRKPPAITPEPQRAGDLRSAHPLPASGTKPPPRVAVESVATFRVTLLEHPEVRRSVVLADVGIGVVKQLPRWWQARISQNKPQLLANRSVPWV